MYVHAYICAFLTYIRILLLLFAHHVHNATPQTRIKFHWLKNRPTTSQKKKYHVSCNQTRMSMHLLVNRVHQSGKLRSIQP